MKLGKYLERQQIRQTEFAKLLGVSPGAVWQWCNGHKMRPKYVLKVEGLTEGKVTRHDLRPDIYPKDEQAA